MFSTVFHDALKLALEPISSNQYNIDKLDGSNKKNLRCEAIGKEVMVLSFPFPDCQALIFCVHSEEMFESDNCTPLHQQSLYCTSDTVSWAPLTFESFLSSHTIQSSCDLSPYLPGVS